jgi:hypothetical protein
MTHPNIPLSMKDYSKPKNGSAEESDLSFQKKYGAMEQRNKVKNQILDDIQINQIIKTIIMEEVNFIRAIITNSK